MINKKNFLGYEPIALGIKDAIHVPIASVRAGGAIRPGQRCKFNDYGEAIAGDGPGVADPHLRRVIMKGDVFWMQLDSDSVSSVAHVWSHESISFDPPARAVHLNEYLVRYAAAYGVTYEQLMAACKAVVDTEEPQTHPVGWSHKQQEKSEYIVDSCDLWHEWAKEAGHEFENYGTACCPEMDIPEEDLFEISRDTEKETE